MAAKKEQEKDAFRVTLHGAESYAVGKFKFLKGKARNVPESVAASLPPHKFSITEINPPKEEDGVKAE